jgi:antitoxin (DNA-binding transcriptional repressor) of toxin-antitoxin stability system
MSAPKTQIVGLKDLRENIEKYSSLVNKGMSFTVVRRSKPIFIISPVSNEEEMDWESVVDFTKLKRGGIKIDDILKRL